MSEADTIREDDDRCLMCGEERHRYGLPKDKDGHDYDAIACVNMLKPALEEARAALTALERRAEQAERANVELDRANAELAEVVIEENKRTKALTARAEQAEAERDALQHTLNAIAHPDFAPQVDASYEAVVEQLRLATIDQANTEAALEQAEAALREVFTLAAAPLAATTPGEPPTCPATYTDRDVEPTLHGCVQPLGHTASHLDQHGDLFVTPASPGEPHGCDPGCEGDCDGV